MKTSKELAEKIDLLKAGNNNVFAEVYEESYKYLHTCVIHIVKNEDSAQDLLQDTYLEIHRNIGQLKSSEDFLSWAATIANRKCFAYLKKDKDVLVDAQADEEGNENDFFDAVADDESFIPENIFDNQAKINIIRGIIDDLTDVQRACVIGFYYNEQKQEEIADQLGIPVNTVKSHLSRAKAKIKESVGDVEKKQGIKLYSLAPFMLLLFGHEAKAYAAEHTVPSLPDALSAGSRPASGSAAAAGVKAAGSAVKIRLIAAIIAGVVGIGAITGVVLYNRSADSGQKEETTDNSAGAVEEEETAKVTETAEASEQIEEIREIDEAPDETGEEPVAESVSEEKASEAEEEAEPVLKKVCDLEETGYESTGNAYGGVLIVCKDGLYGAVDYEMNELVPCQYSGFRAPNNRGYFILYDEENGYLYSPQGELIYTTPQFMIITGNGFIVTASDGSRDGYGIDVTTYYDYSGKELLQTSMGENPAHPVGYHDGYVLLRRFSSDPNGNHCTTEVGKLYDDGTVTWMTEYDGPQVIESDEPEVIPSPDINGLTWIGNSSSAGVYIPLMNLSGMNEGYYVTYHPAIEWGAMHLYDENSELIADFDIKYMDPEGNYTDYMKALESGQSITGTADETNGVNGYYYDGANCYNRGTKMIWTCGDRYILVDAATQTALANYDYIRMAEDDLWLVCDEEKIGFIDPDGNLIAMYDFAGDFYNGYAPVIEDGKAYLIDTALNKVEELGEADECATFGEMYCFAKEGKLTLYLNN